MINFVSIRLWTCIYETSPLERVAIYIGIAVRL